MVLKKIHRLTIPTLVAGLVAGQGFLIAQSPDARAREIVSHMTLDEKIQELHGIRTPTEFRYVPPVPRLHIPALRVTNGPAGAANGGPGHQGAATALPAPIALAATWDVGMAKLYGKVEGTEARALANDLMEAPDVNIARVPQNGRTFEGLGEDPYLAGRLAVADIEGIQGEGVIANVKHYVANNQEESRFQVNEIIGERALREIYLPAFEASVKQGQVASLMCAYPKVNGYFNCENDTLMNKIIKQEWGFQGFITSDFGAVHSTIPSALAGLDLEMPTGKYFSDDLKAAVESGKLPVKVIDDKLVRRFRTMIRFGVFDHPATLQPVPEKEDGVEARKIAEAGMVLLQNKGGELPLKTAQLHSIALIGPYAAEASTGGGGSSHVRPLYSVAPLKGIEARVGPNIKVSFDDGSDTGKAAALARTADVAIVMVGDRETEGRDHGISLSGNQDALVEAVAAANPRTVVVIKSGSAVLMPWVDKVPAILEAWFPGEEDGNAVAAVLFGDVNPSGKLPLSFPKSLADLAANTPAQYPGVDGEAHYSEGIYVGYRHYDAKGIEPLFAFGHGLSYTSFAYKNLKISSGTIRFDNDSQRLTVGVDVTNSGPREGAEVVQLYVGKPASAQVSEPPKELEGFQKVDLKSHQTAHLEFSLDARALSHWATATHAWAVSPGTYQILMGSSSRDIRLRGQVTVASAALSSEPSKAD